MDFIVHLYSAMLCYSQKADQELETNVAPLAEDVSTYSSFSTTCSIQCADARLDAHQHIGENRTLLPTSLLCACACVCMICRARTVRLVLLTRAMTCCVRTLGLHMSVASSCQGCTLVWVRVLVEPDNASGLSR